MNTVLLHDNYDINSDGHFTVCGHDTTLLAKKYGTPLYVFDEDKMREMCRTYIAQIGKYFDKFKVFFASKALCFKEIYRIAHIPIILSKQSPVNGSSSETITPIMWIILSEAFGYSDNGRSRTSFECAVTRSSPSSENPVMSRVW